MQISSFFGYKCPNGHCKIDIAVGGQDKLLCPTCQAEMVPDSQGQVSSGNVYCSGCQSSFGLINSDKCPNCGKPF